MEAKNFGHEISEAKGDSTSAFDSGTTCGATFDAGNGMTGMSFDGGASFDSGMTGTGTGMAGMSAVMSFDMPLSTAAKLKKKSASSFNAVEKRLLLERIASSGTIHNTFETDEPSTNTTFDDEQGFDVDDNPGSDKAAGSASAFIHDLPLYFLQAPKPDASNSPQSPSNNSGAFQPSLHSSLSTKPSLKTAKSFAEDGAPGKIYSAPLRRRKSELIARLNGNKNFSLIPSIEELCQELGVAPEALEKSKRENYQRKFRLWSKRYLSPFSLSRSLSCFPSFACPPHSADGSRIQSRR